MSTKRSSTLLKSQHNQGTKEVDELLSQDLEVMGLNPILQFLADNFFQKDLMSELQTNLLKKLKYFEHRVF